MAQKEGGAMAVLLAIFVMLALMVAFAVWADTLGD